MTKIRQLHNPLAFDITDYLESSEWYLKSVHVGQAYRIALSNFLKLIEEDFGSEGYEIVRPKVLTWIVFDDIEKAMAFKMKWL